MVNILDQRLLTSRSTQEAPILAIPHLLFFPEEHHRGALLKSAPKNFNPTGLWRCTGNITKMDSLNPGCDPIYEMERVITSSSRAEVGEKVKLRMSVLLRSARKSGFHDSGVKIGEGNLEKVNPTHVRFNDPDNLYGYSGSFNSPFGIFSIKRLESSSKLVECVRVATWRGQVREANLSNIMGLTLEEIELPPLGEVIRTNKVIPEEYMRAVDMAEIGL